MKPQTWVQESVYVTGHGMPPYLGQQVAAESHLPVTLQRRETAQWVDGLVLIRRWRRVR